MSTETPLDLKKTVNLPKTNFSQKANLAQSEPVRLKKWEEIDLYRLIQESRAGREKFIMHDGPPYANADIHLGTAMNKILKDFIVKSRTMMGFDTPYVPGYDCHGLPIETHVEKALEKKGKKKTDLSAETFRRICREHAENALKNQTRDFKRLGILGEWDNPYLTMSNHHEAETARMFGRFVARGWVDKGARPVYWCIKDQTALAEAEVEYHQHTSPSVYVKFPLQSDPALIDPALAGRNVFVVIWTTTPWTLPANLGIAVHPDYEYSAFEHGDEVYIVASDLVESVAAKCNLSASPKLMARFLGSKLDRLECSHAWLDRPSLLMVGEHVTLGGEADAETELDVSEAQKKSDSKAGTGCVHTAPGHGHDDFVIGKKYGLEIYCPVDNAGRFTPEVEHFAGQRVFDANDPIVEFMRDRGVLLFSEKYEHRYPHCWRCKNPVIFRATPQWFIAMDQAHSDLVEKDEDGRDRTNFTDNLPETPEKSLRGGAVAAIERVRWIPGWGVDRMRNMLKGRPDWCVSRQRVWGVSIPVFYCARCTEAVADPSVINHVTDIFDVWFDSGTSSIAVLENRPELRWPADVYIEGGDQFRGWFNSSLMIGIAAHDRAPSKTVITHGWTLDAQGRAMHKSAGNAIEPDKVIKQSGAEIIRLWCASSNYFDDMRASDEILQRVMDGYRKLRNTARFALGNIDGFDPARDTVPFEEMEEIDRWALAELARVTKEGLAAYEAYGFHNVYRALFNFATVTLSARYFDIIKDRLYTFAPRNKARRSAQTALLQIGDALARMLAPVLVFTADEIWENLPNREEPSIHLTLLPKADAQSYDALLAEWGRLFAIRDDVLRALEEARVAKQIGSSLQAKVMLQASGSALELLQKHQNDLRYLFIVSQVELGNSTGGEGVSITISNADGEKCERCWNYSTRVGESETYPTVCERCVAALRRSRKEPRINTEENPDFFPR